MTNILDRVDGARYLRSLSYEQLEQLATEIRGFLVDTVDCIGGGLVERSPKEKPQAMSHSALHRSPSRFTKDPKGSRR